MRWLVLVSVVCAACAVTPASAPQVETLTLTSKDAHLAAKIHRPARTGRVPAAVLVHGSGRMTADQIASNLAPRLLEKGIAVLAYDKRGVGGSTGEYASIGPANSERMFDLLAQDALAGVDALARRDDIDPARIGIFGVSQAGWIAPLAASRSNQVAYVVLLSGPAVTVGEEIAYSRVAGEDPGSLQGLTEDEIEREYKAFKGPHGFDPSAAITAMRVPSLWVLGQNDRSLPVKQTIANLERIKKTASRPISIHIVPGANHALRNPTTGVPPDFWGVIGTWLSEHGIVR